MPQASEKDTCGIVYNAQFDIQKRKENIKNDGDDVDMHFNYAMIERWETAE